MGPEARKGHHEMWLRMRAGMGHKALGSQAGRLDLILGETGAFPGSDVVGHASNFRRKVAKLQQGREIDQKVNIVSKTRATDSK